MPVTGRRLLHLGGALFQTPALMQARALGCRVILADAVHDVPGRRHADVFEPVSTTDIEGILVVARKYRIDGIMTYASDSSTPAVSEVAAILNLPGNPVHAARVLQRKDLFRQFQRDNHLPHPDFFATHNALDAVTRARSLAFPVIVKPVDAAGSRGQSIVLAAHRLPAAFAHALEHSKCGKVIVETLLQSDMMELDGDVLVKDGALAFRHYGHNYFLESRISNVPSGEVFPGLYGSEIADPLDEQFRVIIKALGLRIGCLNFDGIYSGGVPHILDIGLRNGGNFVPDAIRYSTGYDMTHAAIHAALGVDYPCTDPARTRPVPVATYLVASRTAGTLRNLEFSPELRNHLVEYRPFVGIGGAVRPYTRSDHAVGIAFLRFADMQSLTRMLPRLEQLIEMHVVPDDSVDHAALPA